MDKHDLNHMMIPGELADPRLRTGIGYRDEGREKAMYDRCLSCDVPATTTSTPTPARSGVASTAKDAASPSKEPTKNYMQAYREKQRQTEEDNRKRTESSTALQAKLTQERVQKEQDTQMRTRARSLTDQINYWKGEHAKSTHDEQTIAGNVSSLERELNCIDAKYW